MLYVLCRRAGWEVAEGKRRLLEESGLIAVIPTSLIVGEASRMKCQRAISLADCFTIAIAKLYGCAALFAKRERGLDAEAARRAFKVPLEFLLG